MPFQLSISQIALLVVVVACAVLGGVTRCQCARIDEAESEIVSLKSDLARAEAETTGAREAVMRADEALVMNETNTKEARHEHDARMDAVEELRSDEVVGGWLCEPVPSDVRELFECAADGGGRNGADGGADGTQDAVRTGAPGRSKDEWGFDSIPVEGD